MTGVSLLPSHRNWETGALLVLLSMFQRDGPQVLEKDVPGLQRKNGQSQDSKVNAVRRGRSGAYRLEEACLWLSQSEGSVKAVILVQPG